MSDEELKGRLDRLEDMLYALVERETAKEHYTTEEVGKILGRSEYTVREWCRQGRIKGEKKGSGRGRYQSWVVSHAELLRVQRDGLLPIAG
jgi:transposase